MKCRECGKTTREGKNYCPEHVDRCDYANEVLTRLAKRQAEVAEIKRGHINFQGEFVQDVLNNLEVIGAMKGGLLYRRLGMPFEAFQLLSCAMVKKGLIRRIGARNNSEGTLVLVRN